MFLEIWQLTVLVVLFGLYSMWSRNSGFKSGIKMGVLETLKKLTENKIIMVNGNQIAPYPTVAISTDMYDDEKLDKLKEDITKFMRESEDQITEFEDKNK
jgi:hypothetical protein